MNDFEKLGEEFFYKYKVFFVKEYYEFFIRQSIMNFVDVESVFGLNGEYNFVNVMC